MIKKLIAFAFISSALVGCAQSVSTSEQQSRIDMSAIPNEGSCVYVSKQYENGQALIMGGVEKTCINAEWVLSKPDSAQQNDVVQISDMVLLGDSAIGEEPSYIVKSSYKGRSMSQIMSPRIAEFGDVTVTLDGTTLKNPKYRFANFETQTGVIDLQIVGAGEVDNFIISVAADGCHEKRTVSLDNKTYDICGVKLKFSSTM